MSLMRSSERYIQEALLCHLLTRVHGLPSYEILSLLQACTMRGHIDGTGAVLSRQC